MLLGQYEFRIGYHDRNHTRYGHRRGQTKLTIGSVPRSQARHGELPTGDYGTIYRQGVTDVRGDTDIDVGRYIADIAARMTERLPELVSIIQQALEEDISDLRRNALTIELLGASVEGNVKMLLRALC